MKNPQSKEGSDILRQKEQAIKKNKFKTSGNDAAKWTASEILGISRYFQTLWTILLITFRQWCLTPPAALLYHFNFHSSYMWITVEYGKSLLDLKGLELSVHSVFVNGYMIFYDNKYGNKWGFPGDSVVQNLRANTGDLRDTGSIPGSGRCPGGGHGNPLQYSCLELSHGQRSLVSYSPQGHRIGHNWSNLVCMHGNKY